MIKKASDIKLDVLPLIITCEHLYYYEGPCRFGKGEALKPGYDRLANEQKAKQFMADLKACLPEGINLLEPVRFARTDDWDNKEAEWEAIAPAMKLADFVVVMSGIACDDIMLEAAERFNRPMAIAPISGFQGSIGVAAIKACQDGDRFEVYGPCCYEDMTGILATARARKVIQNTQILCVTRFGDMRSKSSIDTFNSYDLVTNKLGVRFRFKNVHEFIDQFTPAVEGGNPTTPGRVTPDLDDEDMKKAEAVCDELCKDAKYNGMSRELMLPSCIAYVMTLKNMDLADCNAFTIPCPDVCSTRRINEGKLTFCLTHALNMENGIPSACEYDTSAVVSQQALIAVSGKSPYMGNTCPIPYRNGKLQKRFGVTDEQIDKLMELGPENVYMIQHSVAHRHLPDTDTKHEVGIEGFAYDQNFGVTMRYDFGKDAGKTITMCRFTPDASKLFIGKGEIIMGGGAESSNCTQMVFFHVKDAKDTWNKQCLAGNHVCMVYGDWTQELTDLAVSLGVEPLVAE